ncbi:MAG: tetratricopeptide repeat protein [Saprospirales bacterium]|nr:tetratricopeptide repeat protein [Saprospirales bacterium]
MYEKRDYFKAHDPEKIKTYVDLTTRLLPLEKYTALLDGGFVFQSNDQFDEAEKWFREAIDLNPQRGSGWINLGYILEKKEQYGESEKAFQKALEPEPDYFDAHWGLAYLYERMEGQETTAIQTLETCRRLRPAWEIFIIPRIADLHRKLGKVAEANALLLDCLKKFPDKDAEPLRLLHEDVNNLPEEEALGLLERIRELKGKAYADNFANRAGNVKFQYQKFEEAAAYYRQALAIDPNVPIYHYNLGLSMDRLERLDEAEAAFGEYLALETPSPENLNTIGVFYYKKRQQYEKAASFYQKAIEGNPQNDNFHYNMALVQEKLEQWSDAEASYLKAIECDPEDPENFNGLGVFYYNRRLYEQAIENYQKAIALNATEALYFANLGLAHQQMGHQEEELAAYGQAAVLNPRYRMEVGRVYYNREQYAEAIQAFEQAGDLIDQYPVNLAYWGLAYESLGKPDLAEPLFRKALEKTLRWMTISITGWASYATGKTGTRKPKLYTWPPSRWRRWPCITKTWA